MPNTPVPAAGGAMPAEGHPPTRRRLFLLAGQASAVAAVTAALARPAFAMRPADFMEGAALLAGDDPSFAAVREFEAASRAYLEAPERDEIRGPFFEIRADKLQALGEIMPSTKAGALQLLSAVYEEEEPYLDENSPLRGVIENLLAFLEGPDANV